MFTCCAHSWKRNYLFICFTLSLRISIFEITYIYTFSWMEKLQKKTKSLKAFRFNWVYLNRYKEVHRIIEWMDGWKQWQLKKHIQYEKKDVFKTCFVGIYWRFTFNRIPIISVRAIYLAAVCSLFIYWGIRRKQVIAMLIASSHNYSLFFILLSLVKYALHHRKYHHGTNYKHQLIDFH